MHLLEILIDLKARQLFAIQNGYILFYLYLFIFCFGLNSLFLLLLLFFSKDTKR